MAYESLIKNGTLIDGSGAPAFRGDVAVQDGRIAEIGRIADGADSGIDAADCMGAPGFIDPHTHYDAQICWDDPALGIAWPVAAGEAMLSEKDLTPPLATFDSPFLYKLKPV